MIASAAIDFLNTNSAAIVAIATVVLVAITGLYAWLTARISRATEKSASSVENQVQQQLRLARLDIAQRMIDRFLRTIDAIQIPPHDQGAQALKTLWVLGKQAKSPIWQSAMAGQLDELRTAGREFFEAYLTVREQKISGDFETLVFHYGAVFEFIERIGTEDSASLLDYLKRFHPREMAFLCFIVCTARPERNLAAWIVRYGVLDRAIELEAMLPSHKRVIEKIAAEKS